MTLAEAVRLASSRDTWQQVDVEAVMAGLAKLSRKELVRAMWEAGIGTGQKHTKTGLLCKINNRLTAIPRALERAAV